MTESLYICINNEYDPYGLDAAYTIASFRQMCDEFNWPCDDRIMRESLQPIAEYMDDAPFALAVRLSDHCCATSR
jgi:hypothetical protein